MRPRVLLVALGIVALAALALGRGPARRAATPPPARPAATPRAEAAPALRAVDPGQIRDVFHQDEPPRPAGMRSRAAAPAPGARPSAAPSGPRLVGLVSRGGRTLAALAADGEVVLAGAGEAAAGVTVLAIDDDGVRIRRADGSEETLALP